MKKKLFVLSMDAMVREDIEYMMTKPNFSALMNHCAQVKHLRSVYPASTYPAHTTLVTGCHPDKHGIYANLPLCPFNDGKTHWYLYHKDVWAEDIFVAAKRVGCSTAAVFWPITGCNPNIDHIINEYFFYYPDETERVEETFAKQGADEVALQAIRENMHRFPKQTSTEPLDGLFDDFIMGCTCSLIRNVQPDVLLVHNCIIDTYRHRDGLFGKLSVKALDATDEWLGEVIDAMRDAGVYDDTDFIILSDHGHRDYVKRVKLNVLLERGGFIDVAPDGTIYRWQAYAQSNGQSTTVHLCDKDNERLWLEVYDYLTKLKDEGCWGIREILTEADLKERYHQSGPYSFMVDAEDGISFSDAWTGDVITELPSPVSNHGHMPEKGPQPIFLGRGPSFKPNTQIDTADLTDIAPTLASILGSTLPDADGRSLTELLN